MNNVAALEAKTSEMNSVAALEAKTSMVQENKEAKVASTPAQKKLSAIERLKILQISEWSLKHVIRFFDMVEKNEIELRQIKEKYEKVCRQFLPGGLIKFEKEVLDSALLKRVKDELDQALGTRVKDELDQALGKRVKDELNDSALLKRVKDKLDWVLGKRVKDELDPAIPVEKYLIRLLGNVYELDPASGKVVMYKLDPALGIRLKDELKRFRKNDQQTEWFIAFKEEGYLRKSEMSMQVELVREGSALVEDQQVLEVVEDEDVTVSKAKAFMVEKNKEAAVVPKVVGDETPIIVPEPMSDGDLECNEVMESIQCIYEAVEGGQLDEFKKLMKLIPVKHWLLSPKEYKGATPLHWAALHGQVGMVSFIRKEIASFIRASASASWKGPSESEANMIGSQIVNARDEYGFTPLHLAVYYTKLDTARSIKDSQMIEDLFKMGAANCPTTSASSSVIDTDCLSNPVYPIHLAIWFAHPLIVEKLLESWPGDAFVKTKRGDSTLHLAAWCANMDNDGGDVMSLLLNYLDHSQNANVINSLNYDIQSPLHIATLHGNVKCVEALLRCEQIKVDRRNWKGHTPSEIATVKLKQFKVPSKSSCSGQQNDEHDNHVTRMKDEDYTKFGVSNFVDEYDDRRIAPMSGMEIIHRLYDGFDVEALHKERQVYVDAANAILVGAALIASASFGAWLQPPLGYVPYYSSRFLVTDIGAPQDTYEAYVAIKQHWIIQLFWIFNSLSFFFSLATVIAGADAALPRQGLILKDAVDSVRRGVNRAAWLLSLAILFVIGTFTTIGFAILPPIEKYRINMYITVFIGLSLCGFVLLKLFQKTLDPKLDKKHIETKNLFNMA